MNRYGLLGLMGAGAGALAASEDAEAGVYPWMRRSILENYHRHLYKPRWGKDPVLSGYFEDPIYKQVQKYFPDVENKAYMSQHPLEMRLSKHKWRPNKTINKAQELLNDPNAQIVKNYNVAGKNSEYVLLLPYADRPIMAPLVRNHNGGGLVFKTVMEPSQSMLERFGYGVEGGKPLILRNRSNARTLLPGPPNSQLEPDISDVTPYAAGAFLPATGSEVNRPGYENPYLKASRPVNRDPYLKDAIERDPLIDPIGAIFWGAGLGGGLAKGAASKLLGYAGDLIGGGILDAFETGADAPQEGEPFDDTYGDGILWHMGLKN